MPQTGDCFKFCKPADHMSMRPEADTSIDIDRLPTNPAPRRATTMTPVVATDSVLPRR